MEVVYVEVEQAMEEREVNEECRKWLFPLRHVFGSFFLYVLTLYQCGVESLGVCVCVQQAGGIERSIGEWTAVVVSRHENDESGWSL